MLNEQTIKAFLESRRIAVVGAGDAASNFGGTVYKELRAHGYDVVPVNPRADVVAGDACYPDLDSIPAPVDGVVVMVKASMALTIVKDCIRLHVPRVWLFKGLGSAGAMSDEAAVLCRANGIDVVEGACPLMFLEPVGWFHRIHRGAKRLNGSLPKAS